MYRTIVKITKPVVHSVSARRGRRSSRRQFNNISSLSRGKLIHHQSTSSRRSNEMATKANAKGLNVSFSGCGFLGIYHIGVAACFKKYSVPVEMLSGASAGAMAAVCLLCDAPMGQVAKEILNIATVTRAKALGPFSPSFNISKVLREGLERIFPEDAHLRVNGKVSISLTRVHDRKNVTVSHFDSREELLEVIMASSFVPFFSGMLPPTYRGVRYVDGGFTDNCPIRDENTITVAPFCGESDICPKDESYAPMQVNLCNTSIELSRENAVRFSRTLFPPSAEYLSQVCHQGFTDALRYLTRADLIGCTSCMMPVPENSTETQTLEKEFEEIAAMAKEFDDQLILEGVPNCDECTIQKQAALVDHALPDAMLSMLQNAIDAGKQGFFSYRGARLLTLAALPALLPVDLAYATTRKTLQTLPSLAGHLLGLSGAMARLAVDSFLTSKSNTSSYSAKVSYQVEISEYNKDGGEEKHFIHQSASATTTTAARIPFDFGLIVSSILL